jgi:hypothetical protein
MIAKRAMILTESEKNDIRSLYGLKRKKEHIFEAYITINEEFMIFNDYLYSLKENKLIGYLWESIDNFKLLFENYIPDNEKDLQLKEDVLNYPLLEEKENLYELRDLLLKEGFFGDLVDKAKNMLNIPDGIVNYGINLIGKSLYEKFLNLLKGGIINFLRGLKEMMFSVTGMVVDSVLQAFMGPTAGVSKILQTVPYVAILGLEIYQWVNNDYEGETPSIGWRIFDISFCLLALGFGGVFAKGVLSPLGKIFKSGKSEAKIAEEVAKSSEAKGILKKILTQTEKIPTFIKNTQNATVKNFPQLSKFLGSITGGISKVVTEINNYIKNIIAGGGLKAKATKGAIAGAKTYGVLKGIEYGIEKGKDVYNYLTGNKTNNNENLPDDYNNINNSSNDENYGDYMSQQLNLKQYIE